MSTGRVVHVVGPVIDVEFYGEEIPALHTALIIREQARELDITLEVEEHLGDNVVRCIAMSSTRGLARGTEVEDTGRPISVPVGEDCLGRVVNLLGQPSMGASPSRASASIPFTGAPAVRRAVPGHRVLRDRHQVR